MSNETFVKHLVECNCILPQFLNLRPPMFHKFVVFSVIDENGDFIPSVVQCPHCEAIHKVVEVFTSKQLPKESHVLVPKVEDIRASLPEKYVAILDLYKCDLTTWQEVQFLIDHEQWGKMVILVKEQNDDGSYQGKYLTVLGNNMCRVADFSTQSEDVE